MADTEPTADEDVGNDGKRMMEADGHEDVGNEIVAIVLTKGNVALGRPQGGHEDDGNNIIAIVLVRGKAAAMRMMAMRSLPLSS